jgi:hypothetical protein
MILTCITNELPMIPKGKAFLINSERLGGVFVGVYSRF